MAHKHKALVAAHEPRSPCRTTTMPSRLLTVGSIALVLGVADSTANLEAAAAAGPGAARAPTTSNLVDSQVLYGAYNQLHAVLAAIYANFSREGQGSEPGNSLLCPDEASLRYLRGGSVSSELIALTA